MIFVFGVGNYIYLSTYLWLGSYYSEHILHGKKYDTTFEFSLFHFLSSFKLALIFYFLPLIVVLIYLLHTKNTSEIKSKQVKYYAVFVLFFSVISFVCLFLFAGDAADCEKLPSDKEKEECRQKL